MRQAATGLVTLFWMALSFAAPAPLQGPAPDWVKPQTFSVTADAQADGAPVVLLLSDTQIRLSQAGEDTYSETAYRIETPRGLAAAGDIGFTWQPDIQTVTVHKVHILRDGAIIDLLANGPSFTILRREENLEYAEITGALTAVLQAEGLRVGDIIDLALTTTTVDPVLAGFPQAIVGIPLAKARRISVRGLWDRNLKINWHGTGVLAAAKERRDGNTIEVSQLLDDYEPATIADDAPARFQIPPHLQFSGFRTWQQVAATLTPLFARSAQLAADSPLHAEVARIREQASTQPEQAALALRLVQDQVRYLLLGINDGRLVPATADETWMRRYGDCKGKTALLLGLLRELGISAEPVLVNSDAGDALDASLPMLRMFDHVLVRARIDAKDYWLDGTRTGDRSLANNVAPPIHFGLPLTAKTSKLLTIAPEPPARPLIQILARYDFSNGIAAAAPVEVEGVIRGDPATFLGTTLVTAGKEAQDEFQRGFWGKAFGMVEGQKTSSRYDDVSGEYMVTLSGTLQSQWNAGRFISHANRQVYNSNLATVDPTRTLPYRLAFPQYVELTEVVTLPREGDGFRLDATDVAETLGGAEMRRTAKLDHGVATFVSSYRTLRTELSAAEYPEFTAKVRAVGERNMAIVSSASYRPSDTDLEVITSQADEIQNPDQLRQRSMMLIRAGNVSAAITLADQTVAKHPTDLTIRSLRAWIRASAGDRRGAEEDLRAVLTLDPNNVFARLTQASIAMAGGHHAEAQTILTTVLEQDPRNVFALHQRASSRLITNDLDGALADAKAAIAIDLTDIDAYDTGIAALLRRDDKAAARTLADELIAANPNDAPALITHARTYATTGDRDQAMQSVTRALAIKQDVNTYLLRASIRAEGDDQGIQDDIAAALALDPTAPAALAFQSRFRRLHDQRDTAIQSLNEALQRVPDTPANAAQRARLLAERASAHINAGELNLALADNREALRLAPELPNLYLVQVRLLYGIGERDAAIAAAPAMVEAFPNNSRSYLAAAQSYLFLKMYAEAEQSFVRALEIGPDEMTYLLRAEARSIYDPAGSREDLAAVLRLNPTSFSAIGALADSHFKAAQYPEAIDGYRRAVTLSNNDPYARAMLASALVRGGQEQEAAEVLKTIRADGNAMALNNLCWVFATRDLALEDALRDCDSALRLQPSSAAIMDSRGFTLLRLMRYQEAVDQYDAALALAPSLSSSLYGRGLALRALGQTEAGNSSIDAARRLNPAVDETFRVYGLAP